MRFLNIPFLSISSGIFKIHQNASKTGHCSPTGLGISIEGVSGAPIFLFQELFCLDFWLTICYLALINTTSASFIILEFMLFFLHPIYYFDRCFMKSKSFVPMPKRILSIATEYFGWFKRKTPHDFFKNPDLSCDLWNLAVFA